MAADTVEVLRLCESVAEDIDKRADKLIDPGIRVTEICDDSGQIRFIYFRACFHQCAKVFLRTQIAVDQISDRLSGHNRPMTVAEPAVVKKFETIAHRVIFDRKCVDHRVRAVDVPAKKGVKAVFVNTVSTRRATHTTQASSGKRNRFQIYDLTISVEAVHKSADHRGQARLSVLRIIVRDKRDMKRFSTI